MTATTSEYDASWQGAKVSPAAVERALSRMLRNLADPGDSAGQHPHARASVLNLIIHIGPDSNDARATDALRDLADNHPSRTLVIAADPSAAESSLDAQATAHCHLRTGIRGRVCYEEARLTARGELASHLASIVEPLLVPDLPVVLWWLDGVPEATDELLPLCDRLVVRSRELAWEDVRRLARLTANPETGVAVGDLTWGALAPWRELLAQLFDPPPARLRLPSITDVRLRYSEGDRPWEALLLLGWLASRLGWAGQVESIPSDDHRSEWRFRSSVGDVRVAAHSVARAESQLPGGLVAVTLESQAAGAVARFEVERHADGVCAAQRSTLPDGPTVDRMVPLTLPTLASLIGRELSLAGRDAAYEASLAVAASLVS